MIAIDLRPTLLSVARCKPGARRDPPSRIVSLQMRIYLDHNATTPPAPAVVERMAASLREDFGNPSSVHHFGQRTLSAETLRHESRRHHCDPQRH